MRCMVECISWPPFIIGLPYDPLHPFCSRQFAYWLLSNGQQCVLDSICACEIVDTSNKSYIPHNFMWYGSLDNPNWDNLSTKVKGQPPMCLLFRRLIKCWKILCVKYYHQQHGQSWRIVLLSVERLYLFLYLTKGGVEKWEVKGVATLRQTLQIKKNSWHSFTRKMTQTMHF